MLIPNGGRGVVNAADLPDRVAEDRHSNALVVDNVDNYRNYAAFIRGISINRYGALKKLFALC